MDKMQKDEQWVEVSLVLLEETKTHYSLSSDYGYGRINKKNIKRLSDTTWCVKRNSLLMSQLNDEAT